MRLRDGAQAIVRKGSDAKRQLLAQLRSVRAPQALPAAPEARVADGAGGA
jgi:hypothetical protein